MHLDLLAIITQHWLDRQIREVEIRVVLLLPAVGIEVLLKVTVAIEQTDTDQRQAQFRSGLEVIARQAAEAA